MKRIASLTFALLTIATFSQPSSEPQSERHRAAAFEPPAPDGLTPGRFQLFAATVEEGNVRTKTPVVFRIDSATGRVWEFSSDTFDGGINGPLSIAHWSPVAEDALGLYQSMGFTWPPATQSNRPPGAPLDFSSNAVSTNTISK
jgi:hypothetical protein